MHCLLRSVAKFFFFHILVTAQWKRLPISNDEPPPPPRAYHTMTSIGARHLLIGGFDGKSTFGDLWWLVPEGILLLFVPNVSYRWKVFRRTNLGVDRSLY